MYGVGLGGKTVRGGPLIGVGLEGRQVALKVRKGRLKKSGQVDGQVANCGKIIANARGLAKIEVLEMSGWSAADKRGKSFPDGDMVDWLRCGLVRGGRHDVFLGTQRVCHSLRGVMMVIEDA